MGGDVGIALGGGKAFGVPGILVVLILVFAAIELKDCFEQVKKIGAHIH
ncbi:MAG: hypothetical protein P0Y55_10015 [Candidatus Cohnella colombiensis]|uniref:Uncharacterized protein n=1 Tax=Candidatus Cohnella colombiensis TaxID=3121368 RepID=A0AA95EUF1_9BACL|nr:MAG: hypothetical protein P0Y55_10015 [Cohnella sp.]